MSDWNACAAGLQAVAGHAPAAVLQTSIPVAKPPRFRWCKYKSVYSKHSFTAAHLGYLVAAVEERPQSCILHLSLERPKPFSRTKLQSTVAKVSTSTKTVQKCRGA